MVNYQCPRCHYSTTHRTNLKTHLYRKKTCKNTFNLQNTIDVTRNKFKEDVKLFLKKNLKKKKVEKNSHKIPSNSLKFTQKSLKIPSNSHKIPSNSLKIPSNSLKFTQNSLKITQNSLKIPSKSVNFNKLECEFCKKEFSRKDNLERHQSKCKKYNNLIEDYIKKENQLLKEQLQKFEDREKKWAERETSLRHEIEKLLEKVGNVTHITNQQNIYINNHGHENLEYISGSYMSKLLKIPFGALPKLIKHIHFNPNHPENHNIKITNKKLPYASVWEGDKWTVKDKKEVISNMVDKGFNILDDHYDNTGKESLNNNQTNRYSEFKTKFQAGDKKLTKNVVRDTEITVINQSK